jgi:hypothetical protein
MPDETRTVTGEGFTDLAQRAPLPASSAESLAVRSPATRKRPSHTPLRRRPGLLVVSLAAVLATTLCGCGSRGSLSPSSAPAPRRPVSVPALPSAAAVSSAPDPPSAQPPPPGGSAPAGQVCQAITLSLPVLTTVAQSPDDPSIDEGIAQLRALRDTAPAGIRNDLQVIADFDDEMVTTVRSGRSPANLAETPRVTQALSREAQRTAAHCPR